MFRSSSRRQRIFAILMMLSLLFQVQTAVACQMMEATVPAHDCCCEEMAHEDKKRGAEHTIASEQNSLQQKVLQSESQSEESCCVLDAQLTLKEPDLSKDLPAIIQAVDDFELPEMSAYLLLAAIWPKDLADSSSPISWIHPPQFRLSGTKTYLSTQRLRI